MLRYRLTLIPSTLLTGTTLPLHAVVGTQWHNTTCNTKNRCILTHSREPTPPNQLHHKWHEGLEIHGGMQPDWHVRMRTRVTNVVDVYTDVPTDNQVFLELNAVAVLWELRKEAQSVWPLHYHRSTSAWCCPWSKIVSVRKTLGAPHPIGFDLRTPGGTHLIGSWVIPKEKLQLMWQNNPAVTPGKQVVVGVPLMARNFGNVPLSTLR